MDLQNIPAKRCYTAAGMLIHDGKVLLIKHKKIGIWFCPGGHIDENELPHQAAEREFLEETGVEVVAYDPHYVYEAKYSEYVPSPVETNLHWVSEENYKNRIMLGDSYKPSPTWKRGCEQHLGFVYLMKPVGSLQYSMNERESDGIDWFTLEELKDLETDDDIRAQIAHGFKLLEHTKNDYSK